MRAVFHCMVPPHCEHITQGVNRNFTVIVNNGNLIYPPVIIRLRPDYNLVAFVLRQRKTSIIYAYPSVLVRT
jgi:hypothetical protein